MPAIPGHGEGIRKALQGHLDSDEYRSAGPALFRDRFQAIELLQETLGDR